MKRRRESFVCDADLLARSCVGRPWRRCRLRGDASDSRPNDARTWSRASHEHDRVSVNCLVWTTANGKSIMVVVRMPYEALESQPNGIRWQYEGSAWNRCTWKRPSSVIWSLVPVVT